MKTVTAVHGSLVILALALILAAVVFLPVSVLPWLATFGAIGVLVFFAKYKLRLIAPAGLFRNLVWGELGAVSVLYFVRDAGVLINGSATPPTASQAAAVPAIKAQIAMGDADVQALFTHNWGLDASAPTYLEPELFLWQQQLTANGTWQTALTFDLTNTNVVKVNKFNFAQSGGTWILTARRPLSARG